MRMRKHYCSARLLVLQVVDCTAAYNNTAVFGAVWCPLDADEFHPFSLNSRLNAGKKIRVQVLKQQEILFRLTLGRSL